MKAWAYVMLAVTAIGGFLALMFGARKAGRDAAENEAKEEVIENIDKTDRAKRRLSDPARRKRLRDKFTRK